MWGNDGPGWGMGMGMGHWRWGRGPDWMLDRVEGRLAFMKAELKITETQTTTWNQLADAIRTAAKHHNERMKAIFAGEEKSKTLPERVDAQEQFMSVRLEEINQDRPQDLVCSAYRRAEERSRRHGHPDGRHGRSVELTAFSGLSCNIIGP